MVTVFDRWEKDPFFAAAEEVQESADRMESAYRAWIHAEKDPSSMWNFEELRRDLRTALGTTKWQLDEFERAVQSSYKRSSGEDTVARHREFIVAIEDQILKIEKSLNESARLEGKASLPWVHLDEGESNELALFLTGTKSTEANKTTSKSHVRVNKCPQDVDREVVIDCSKDASPLVQFGSNEDANGRKPNGHRRTASADADIGTWTVAINDNGLQQTSSNSSAPIMPRKVPSFSVLLDSMEATTRLKWPRNGIRKWKTTDRHEESDTESPQSTELTRGINACYERSKSCLDCDNCYDKQLYGWYGAIHRQLQRSQYQMQYGRPARIAVWMFLLLSLIVILALHTI